MSGKKEKTGKKTESIPLYAPKDSPMNIIVFASGGGGNLQAAIDLSLKKPQLIKVGLVVTDRLGIRAIDIAKKYKIPVIARDFEKYCGVWIECKDSPEKRKTYEKKSIEWHDNILSQILELEMQSKTSFDFVVLSYHRWIRGKLLEHFAERMINQHAGDLTIVQNLERKYTGINPVLMALKEGEKRTRTSTFLVRDNRDGGEILCQGPWVEYYGVFPATKKSALEHELLQKRQSDWPSLAFALENLALGKFGITKDKSHPDGCNIITHDGKTLKYGGIDIS